MNRTWMPAVLLLVGLFITGMAIFAGQIGLDHNTSWGQGRIILLLIGIIITVGGFALWRYVDQLTAAARGVQSWFQTHPVMRWWHANRIVRFFAGSRLAQVCLLVVPAAGFVIAVYIWFASVGLWTVWPKTTFAYDLLASSFQRGQLALDYKPDPALLALSDPYDPDGRGGIPFLWDASLYNGRYYLYFGPVPALILAGAKAMLPGQIADQYLVFAFACGLFIFNVLLIVSLWQRFFPSLPGWTVLVGVLFAGLVCPAVWLLSRPAVYEAAIASSQFFFMGGFFLAYAALGSRPLSAWKLMLAGSFWAAAVGSRTTAAVPVLFMTAMLFWWMFKSHPGSHRALEFISKLAALALPLGIGAAALGWYNRARFGSAFEFGLRYQLTWINLNKFYGETLSPVYLLPNLYNYLLTPFEVVRMFPFIKPGLGQTASALHLAAPNIYRSELVTGMLFSSPFLLLALVPVLSLLTRESRKLFKHSVETNREGWLLAWTSIGLTGSALLSFALILFFFYATMRYLEDVVPSLALLAVMGFWQGYQFLGQKPYSRIAYTLLSVGLAGFSVLSGALLAVTGYEERFKHLNRALLEQMIRFFGR